MQRQQENFMRPGLTLYVTGRDENGDNTYECRGKGGAWYISERSRSRPTVLRFVQARDQTFGSIYGSRLGKTINFCPQARDYRDWRLDFTDIDGPLRPIQAYGWEHASEVPGAVSIEHFADFVCF